MAQQITVFVLCEQAFERLRTKYEIDPSLDRFEAMDELQNTHGVWPPINIRSMTFTYDTRKEAFISKYGLEIKETDAEGKKTVERVQKDFDISKCTLILWSIEEVYINE